ncbi:hypothetical protein [Maribacter sp. ACAM166]|uniref:hypothetical protein n=1 Tax=Maribacter sp. ACAM166 TaxID=2508996 RepID=UPI001BB0E2D9|nr:hypothetical protein [Maribacter sp. ACAM166]
MSKQKNLFKKKMFTIASVVEILVLSVFLFTSLSPQFGGKSTKAQKERHLIMSVESL